MVYRALFCLLAVWGSVLGLADASGAIIYESGTLGATGVTWQQAQDGEVEAESIQHKKFTGARLHLDQPVQVTHIGGHFFAPTAGTFFGAIVELDDENDFPDSEELDTPDVVGSTLLTFPAPSGEVFGTLSISLNPGWYAVVFGSDIFSATGSGGVVSNSTDIGTPDYIGFLNGFGWGTRSPSKRFVIKGNIVPEPTVAVMLSIFTLLTLTHKPRRKP